ncbi:hypothetical protein [Algibacillus agarilyticus]|uniref:hypothetical protein n=1 Tax=Algibacillus agarilyticus TaxID=2234133 RepID=UPI000DD05C10|nr:hypothetical protein [Algibacillus agarilyticus]
MKKTICALSLCISFNSFAGCCDWVKNLEVKAYGTTWDPSLIHIETINSSPVYRFSNGVVLGCSAAQAGHFYYPNMENALSDKIIKGIAAAYHSGKKVDLWVTKYEYCRTEGAKIEGYKVHD